MMEGRELVFEIGCEELPSAASYQAIQQLRVLVPKALANARLEYGSIDVYCSPRRLAVIVKELADRQPDATVRHKGPSAKVAFDEAGDPTKAAVGFARGKGVDVASLTVVEDEGGSYVYAVQEIDGADTLALLPEMLAGFAADIEWPRSMRWGSADTRFSRPVRWLMALYGTEVVPVEFAGLVAGRSTFGHRFLADEIELAGAYEYVAKLEEAKVVVDQAERARVLKAGIDTIAAQFGGTPVIPEDTFAEVVNLVEWPTVGLGTFDEDFLRVPREMLESAMGKHQRYFPVELSDGSLDNHFIVAHNGDPARTESIVAGHERVLRARLSDAAFFYDEDLKISLEHRLSHLDAIVFQEKLGSLGEKVERIERLAGEVARLIDAPADETAWALRAAHLGKADLVSGAVIEFTDLQGTMGRYYALADGEAAEVALAIEEHYRPRGASDALPSAIAGRIVAIADKLDTICGIFAIGKAPTGSADPFALRRSANGILQIALAGTDVSLDEAISSALEPYLAIVPDMDVEAVGAAVKAFFVTRLETILRDRELAYDTVDAVLATAADRPLDAMKRAEALQRFRAASTDMEDLSVAFTRASNLSRPELGAAADVSIMGEHEVALSRALDEAEGVSASFAEQHNWTRLLEAYASLRGPIDAFFENVLVMDEDVTVRENRLRLLNRFVALFSRFADFSRLAG